MSKLNKILLLAAVALIIIIGGFIYWQKSNSTYTAVYLSTGDIYFGKISRFPSFALSDAWFLSKAENGFGVNQLSKAVWGPEGKLFLNKKNVIWTVKLSEDSEFLKALKSPTSAGQGSASQGSSGANQFGSQKGADSLSPEVFTPTASSSQSGSSSR